MWGIRREKKKKRFVSPAKINGGERIDRNQWTSCFFHCPAVARYLCLHPFLHTAMDFWFFFGFPADVWCIVDGNHDSRNGSRSCGGPCWTMTTIEKANVQGPREKEREIQQRWYVFGTVDMNAAAWLTPNPWLFFIFRDVKWLVAFPSADRGAY